MRHVTIEFDYSAVEDPIEVDQIILEQMMEHDLRYFNISRLRVVINTTQDEQSKESQ